MSSTCVPFTLVRQLLIPFCFQTKLDIGASNTSVAEVLHQDLNVHTATSGAHDPAHPRPSDLGDSHLNALKTLEGANRAVGITYASLVVEYLLTIILALRKVSYID